jgi:folate-binding protein YgfZ
MFSTFLHAQGRVLYDVFIYTHTTLDGKPTYLIEYDSRASTDAAAPPLLSMLKRYVLRSKVKLRDVSEEYDVWAAWGSEPESELESEIGERKWHWAMSGAVEPDWSGGNQWPWGMEERRIRDRRAVGMGGRILVKKGDKPKESSTHNLASSDAYTLHRILHGVPEGIHDVPPLQAFPMDSNLDVMGGLDFRKGCYVGQELTVRTYHTGVIRKRILPVLIHPPDETYVRPSIHSSKTTSTNPNFFHRLPITAQ